MGKACTDFCTGLANDYTSDDDQSLHRLLICILCRNMDMQHGQFVQHPKIHAGVMPKAQLLSLGNAMVSLLR